MIKLIATGFGAGYFPVAPGTAGTLVGALIYLLLAAAHPGLTLAAAAVIIAIAIPVSGAAQQAFGTHDDKRIVIDEIAGFLVAVAWLPQTFAVGILAFALFRFFDVAKPLFIRSSQRLPGGWGIVADDILAGVITNILLQATNYFIPL
ncbi:MAG: hypothetical protein A2219_07655 [Elusimicrobia bacterium RIFOXYA2_FULL_50_26]|nr:MAG: hypothetical protein A2219_07655 [Elusimicrobia bacterium RIFOXYA2_FULL_50_26]OGS24365.1 MAG: hypothetical protein A2314_00530 [Elusimicrobia bacterium RIFOXYB2_FULL_50_12]